jgi:hypothetical protein
MNQISSCQEVFYYNIQHKDAQNKGFIYIWDTKHNNALPICCVIMLSVAFLFITMLNAIILSVVLTV